MSTREEFLRAIWAEVINAPMNEAWIDHAIVRSEGEPDAPFSDVGAVLQRLLSLGALPRDLCLLARAAAYEAVFATMYMLDDPGVEGGDVFMLHESLLVGNHRHFAECIGRESAK